MSKIPNKTCQLWSVRLLQLNSFRFRQHETENGSGDEQCSNDCQWNDAVSVDKRGEQQVATDSRNSTQRLQETIGCWSAIKNTIMCTNVK